MYPHYASQFITDDVATSTVCDWLLQPDDAVFPARLRDLHRSFVPHVFSPQELPQQ
jgi:hypothetical protein